MDFTDIKPDELLLMDFLAERHGKNPVEAAETMARVLWVMYGMLPKARPGIAAIVRALTERMVRIDAATLATPAAEGDS